MMKSSTFSMGSDTYSVPMSMHAESRKKLVDRLQRRGVHPEAVVLLQGGSQRMKYDTDREFLFEQESFFQYLFGVKEPGFFGAIQVETGRSILFMPRLPEEWGVWMGRIHPPQHFQDTYEVDEVHYADEISAVLTSMKASSLLLLRGRNSDSGAMALPAQFGGIEKFQIEFEALHPELVECRVHKSEQEIGLLRWINGISSNAHIEVMRRMSPGLMECQTEAAFLHSVYDRGGCRFTAYTCICGCGPNSATLHYGHQGAPNNHELSNGDMFLNDSGAQYHGYASDITCSYPVNGRFTSAQKDIYEGVLAANRAVQQAMKPGISWPDMHRLAVRVIAERLRDVGIIQGSIDELLAAHVPALFMPHGLGHFMGLDVHDPGGYPEGTSRISEPGIRSLRCGRKLEAGMVITVEPGIYFIDAILDPALGNPEVSHLLVPDKLKHFRRFGGIRIEDDVLVTSSGSENFTRVPREVDEIESVMSGGSWSAVKRDVPVQAQA
jgi:Xaa-Pro dipeptidase